MKKLFASTLATVGLVVSLGAPLAFLPAASCKNPPTNAQVNTVVNGVLSVAEEACEIDQMLQGNQVPQAIGVACGFVDDPQKIAIVQSVVQNLETLKAKRTATKK
jgi:hypothetical protein